MTHGLELVLTLTGGLTAAMLFGLVTQRIGLSPIVGYLLAGVAIGPFTPGFVAHAQMAEQLAEIGVILLMFGVGLHFHIEDLLAVRRVALPGAVVQIVAATAVSVLVAHAFGWTLGAGLVLGLAIAVASTVVLLRVLTDHQTLHTPSGHLAIGWLLVEDIFTVLVLVVLPLVAKENGGGIAKLAQSIGIATLKIAALVAFTLVIGRRVIPKLLAYVSRTRSRELFTLCVLALALGIAVGSAELFGASMALGAFLAGMIVGQSEFSARAASEALPMRDAFAVLFFVSMGMLLDPRQIVPNAGLIAAMLAVILVCKPLAAYVVVRVLGRPPKTALTVAIALAQIGEFSFIVAALGRSLGILPANATQALVAASIVSITINAPLFRLIDPLAKMLGKHATPEAIPEPSTDASQRTIVVGYGPVGRTLVRLLRENGLEPTVIDLNHETTSRLRKEGVRAVHGDASQSEILLHAGVAEASSLVFAASGAPDAIVRTAKELNPKLVVLARATYLAEVEGLRTAGANEVVAAEGEVALGMTERLLLRLGATNDQLDRARDRVRVELSGRTVTE